MTACCISRFGRGGTKPADGRKGTASGESSTPRSACVPTWFDFGESSTPRSDGGIHRSLDLLVIIAIYLAALLLAHAIGIESGAGKALFSICFTFLAARRALRWLE